MPEKRKGKRESEAWQKILNAVAMFGAIAKKKSPLAVPAIATSEEKLHSFGCDPSTTKLSVKFSCESCIISKLSVTSAKRAREERGENYQPENVANPNFKVSESN